MCNKIIYLVVVMSFSLLAACSNGGSSGSLSESSGGGGNPSPPAGSNTPELDVVFVDQADSDSVALNAEALSAELDRVFGLADSEPVTVNQGDTINTVRGRAGS